MSWFTATAILNGCLIVVTITCLIIFLNIHLDNDRTKNCAGLDAVDGNGKTLSMVCEENKKVLDKKHTDYAIATGVLGFATVAISLYVWFVINKGSDPVVEGK